MDNLDLNKLHKSIVIRMLREKVAREMNDPAPKHNAGSGIVTGWDPKDALPDMRIGTLLLSVPRLKLWIANLCHKWCERGLVGATNEELDAFIHGKMIVQWFRFEKQCNIPTSKNPFCKDIYNHAMSCFQEECFDRLVGWTPEEQEEAVFRLRTHQ